MANNTQVDGEFFVRTDEQETVIQWQRVSDYANIYTSDTTMINRFDKFVESGDWKLEENHLVGDRIVAKSYSAPKKLVFGRSKTLKPKPLTEEERKRKSESMKKLRAEQIIQRAISS